MLISLHLIFPPLHNIQIKVHGLLKMTNTKIDTKIDTSMMYCTWIYIILCTTIYFSSPKQISAAKGIPLGMEPSTSLCCFQSLDWFSQCSERMFQLKRKQDGHLLSTLIINISLY